MTLRTPSLRRQRQVRACLVLLTIIAYVALVIALGLGNPFRFFGAHQMRVLLPLVILFRVLFREVRWDGIVREEKKVEGPKVVVVEDKVEENPQLQTPTLPPPPIPQPQVPTPQPQVPVFSPPPPPPSFPTSYYSAPASTMAMESPEELWERARVMVHKVIPDFEDDAEYLKLIFAAAEQGYVPALAKLGDYAFRRAAFIEAYFWTKLAHRWLELSDPTDSQGLKEIENMLLNIRREWTVAGQPLEYENVYDNFQAERGELGRAFLRIDSGSEVGSTQEFIQALAKKGNPDAALFV